MEFIDAVIQIIQNAGEPLTPLEIRERLKIKYPQFYNTETHRAHVEKGNYQSLDHALMAQVYGLARNSRFICDRSSRPMKLSVAANGESQNEEETDFISVEEIEKDHGSIYILKTDLYTKEGKAIYKIGITSGEVEQRITQLYTTGVPYRFQIHKAYQIAGFIELERALHALLSGFRLNSSREFFTEDALPFVERIVSLHAEIKGVC